MIQLASSIVSSTISTVLLYPAQRIKLQMQLSTAKKPQSQVIVTKQLTDLLDLQSEETIQVNNQNPISIPKSEIIVNRFKQFDAQQRQSEKRAQNKKQSNHQPNYQRKTSIIQTSVQIYRNNGWTGFYTGLESLVIGNGLSYGVYFVVYQKCKTYLGFKPGSVLDTLKCSAIAGIVATLATNPFWVLQTKQTQQNGSLVQKGKQLIQRQGFAALWKGLSSSLILVSNPIIQFVIYEQLKKATQIQKDSKIYDLIIFIIGAISKMISTLCTYPLTVIRTRQHISVEKKKWSKIIGDIIHQEGPKGLFKGIQPKLIQTVLNSALLLMLFERIRKILFKYLNFKKSV